MDGGKGGQTLSLQEREGENRKLGRKRKNGISRARAIPGKKVTSHRKGAGEGRPEGA